MLIMIISIFYFIICIITSIFFIKKKINIKNTAKIKYLFLYLLYILLYIILLTIGYYIYNFNAKIIEQSCNIMCTYYYTTNTIQIVFGLIINLMSNILFYIFSKKTIINLYNSKFKYIILVVYILIQFIGILFGLLSFYGFMGYFIIKNPILIIFRLVISYLPIVIYPIDIFIIEKIKKSEKMI